MNSQPGHHRLVSMGSKKLYATTLYSWTDAVKRAAKMPDVAPALAPRKEQHERGVKATYGQP